MRKLIFLIVCSLTLQSCTSKPMKIVANRCWAVSVGDRVKGTAVLFMPNADGCIDCSALVSGGKHCSGYAIALGTPAVEQAYERLKRTSLADGEGFLQRKVILTAEAVPNRTSGRPLLRATEL